MGLTEKGENTKAVKDMYLVKLVEDTRIYDVGYSTVDCFVAVKTDEDWAVLFTDGSEICEAHLDFNKVQELGKLTYQKPSWDKFIDRNDSAPKGSTYLDTAVLRDLGVKAISFYSKHEQ